MFYEIHGGHKLLQRQLDRIKAVIDWWLNSLAQCWEENQCKDYFSTTARGKDVPGHMIMFHSD